MKPLFNAYIVPRECFVTQIYPTYDEKHEMANRVLYNKHKEKELGIRRQSDHLRQTNYQTMHY